MKAHIFSTQVASSVPFDNVDASTFLATDVQAALKETRDQLVFNSITRATTASGTLTLVRADNTTQILTGTATGYNVRLPDATTLPLSIQYQIVNASSQTVQIKDGAGINLFVLGQQSIGYALLQLNGSAAGTWLWYQATLSVASGIINYNVTSTTAFATTSSTDVMITGASVTPQSGTYAIWYNSSNLNTTNNANCTCTIYKAGSSLTDSLRTFQTSSSNNTFQHSTLTIVNVDGTQTLDVRVSTSTGTLTVNGRSLLLVRLGV